MIRRNLLLCRWHRPWQFGRHQVDGRCPRSAIGRGLINCWLTASWHDAGKVQLWIADYPKAAGPPIATNHSLLVCLTGCQ
jgi:hypothetical protein